MSQSSCPGMWGGSADSAMPGWPRAYAGGSQLLLRATLPSSDPEACRHLVLSFLGVLSILRSGLVTIDPEGDPAFMSSLEVEGLYLWKSNP